MSRAVKINKAVTKQFGANLYRIRDANGFTREELVERTGLSPQNIAKIENGDRFITSESVSKLAQAFRISIADLFDFSELKGTQRKPNLLKITTLLKSRSEEDLIFVHELLTLVLKKVM